MASAVSSQTPRRGSAPKTKPIRAVNSAGKRPDTQARRSSLKGDKDIGQNSPPKRQSIPSQVVDTPPPKQHTTAVVVHVDEDEKREDPSSLSLGGLSLDSGQHSAEFSMFAMNSQKSRRASEPGIGGHLLKQLQLKAEEEEKNKNDKNRSDLQPRLGPENEAMKKVIESQLPSNIVAEEDGDEEQNGDERDNDSRSKSTSTAGADFDGDDDDLDLNRNGEPMYDSVQSGEDKLTAKMKALRQRRKSDGDALKFSKAWRVRSTESSQVKPVRDVVKGDEILRKAAQNESTWEAVRKCRYIRGYEPPDMRQPEDLGAFVFGHDAED